VSRTAKPPLGLLLAIVAFLATACATAPPLPTSTAPFLGPRDFTGTYTPRCGNATTGGNAAYHGSIVFTNLDRTIVQSIVPQELTLAANTVASTQHPVIVMYGRPHNSSWMVAGTQIIPGPNYQELMLLVPFVQRPTSTKWHTHVVRMYLDDWDAIWIGNVFFAYGKEWGISVETGTEVSEFAMATQKFHANVTPNGPGRTNAQAEATLPNYSAIKTILDMPIVGRRQDGTLVCSYFELDFTGATITPVSSAHEFLDPFVPLMVGWPVLGSTLTSVPDGAIAVENVNWWIKQPPPGPCRF
jgi:hypothetical protein